MPPLDIRPKVLSEAVSPDYGLTVRPTCGRADHATCAPKGSFRSVVGEHTPLAVTVSATSRAGRRIGGRIVMRHHYRAADDGNISMLTLGLVALAMLVLLVVASATAVHIQRLRLTQLADEMALDAADSLDLPTYYAGDSPLPAEVAAIDVAQARMEAAVVQHLERRDGEHLNGVRILSVTTPDGATAVNTISQTVHPLFPLEPLAPFADGIEIRVTGSARTF